MIRESMVDIQLQDLGLTPEQIHSVKSRIPNNKIPQFIEKMIRVQTAENIDSVQRLKSQGSGSGRNDSMPNNENYISRNTPRSCTQNPVLMKEMYQEYTSKRNDIEEHLELTARRLFGKPYTTEGYSEAFLHKKYKELALIYHPDKNEGDSNMFNLLQDCFKYLHNRLPLNQTENKKIIDRAVSPPKELFKNQGFNVKDFNKYYSENALKPKEHGYGQWLQTAQKTPSQGKVSMSNFNSSFEENRRTYEKMNPNVAALVKKNEPPAEIMANVTLGNSVLGEEDMLDDYSGSTNAMSYTDLKRAHEMSHLVYHTENTIDSQSTHSRFEEANERNQSRPTMMLNAEIMRLEEQKNQSNENEKNREFRMRQLDEDITQHYNKVNRLSIC